MVADKIMNDVLLLRLVHGCQAELEFFFWNLTLPFLIK